MFNPLSWFRRKLDMKNPASWGSPHGRASSRPVNLDNALSVSAYWASVRLIAQTIGTTSMGFYRKLDNGGRESLPKHPLYTVFHDSPNAGQTATEFWEGIAASLMVHGNGYAEKIMSGNKVVGLEFLAAAPTPGHYAYVVPQRLRPGGPLVYRVHTGGTVRDLPSENIFHVRGFGFGGDFGLPSLVYAREALSVAMAAEDVTEKNFREGLRAKGFFTMPGSLDEEQRKQAEKVLVDRYSGDGAKSTGILEAGVAFQATNINAHDAELSILRRMSVEDVCRFMGVPPIMVGHASEGQTMWGSGVEQLLLQFYTTGLRPIMVRIESAIRKSLIDPAERGTHYAEFNIDSLLRADSAARIAYYNGAVTNGIMNRDEVRAKENLPKIAGGAGEIFTVQSAMVDLKQLGQPAAAPGVALPPPTPGERPPLRRVA